jgi:putative membrane protein
MIVCKTIPLTWLVHFVASRVILFLLVDLLIVAGYVFYGWRWLALPDLPLSLIGAALTVFLGFRIKAAYDRWWEARILWGGIVNWSRTLIRRALVFPGSATGYEEHSQIRHYQERMTYSQIAWVHALRNQLRGHDPVHELSTWLQSDEIDAVRNHANVPTGLLLMMGQRTREAFRQGWIDEFRFISIEETLAELINLQGGCERIKNTPFPRQFDYFPKLFANAFCLMLPVGLVANLGLLTPLASSLVAFMILSLESFGKHLEDPFENTINDIPMTALSRTIEINLKQQLGEDRIPPPLHPVEGFLF